MDGLSIVSSRVRGFSILMGPEPCLICNLSDGRNDVSGLLRAVDTRQRHVGIVTAGDRAVGVRLRAIGGQSAGRATGPSRSCPPNRVERGKWRTRTRAVTWILRCGPSGEESVPLVPIDTWLSWFVRMPPACESVILIALEPGRSVTASGE